MLTTVAVEVVRHCMKFLANLYWWRKKILRIFRELSERSQICKWEVNVHLLSSQKHLNLQTQQTGIPRPGSLQQLYSHELDCGNSDKCLPYFTHPFIKGTKAHWKVIIENTSIWVRKSMWVWGSPINHTIKTSENLLLLTLRSPCWDPQRWTSAPGFRCFLGWSENKKLIFSVNHIKGVWYGVYMTCHIISVH